MNDYDTPEIRCSVRNLSRVTEWLVHMTSFSDKMHFARPFNQTAAWGLTASSTSSSRVWQCKIPWNHHIYSCGCNVRGFRMVKKVNCFALQCKEFVTQEITFPRTNIILTIHKHWPPWINLEWFQNSWFWLVKTLDIHCKSISITPWIIKPRPYI